MTHRRSAHVPSLATAVVGVSVLLVAYALSPSTSVVAGSNPDRPDQQRVPEVAAAYNAFSGTRFYGAELGRDLRIALWRAGHTKLNMHTAIVLMNVGDQEAEVTLTLLDSSGRALSPCGAPCRVRLSPGTGHRWWPAELPGVPSDPSSAWGTAEIASTQPVVAVVHDVTLGHSTSWLDAVAYRALAAGQGSGSSDPAVYLPLHLAEGQRPLAAVGERVAAAALDSASAVNGLWGAGESDLQILNRDLDHAARFSGQMFPQGGGQQVAVSGQSEAGAWSQPLLGPGAVRLPPGAYAARFTSDKRLGAVSRTEWPASGGAQMVENSLASGSVRVPFVHGLRTGICSLITIADADRAGNATVEFFEAKGGRPVLTRTYPVPEGASITLRTCDDPDLVASLPSGYIGWAGISTDVPHGRLAVQAIGDVTESERAVFGYQGMPDYADSMRFYAPAVHAAWPAGGYDPLSPTIGRGPRLSSSIVVVNPNTQAARLTATYTGVAGSCGQGGSQGPMRLPALGQVVLRPAEDGTLPAGCLASGVIDVDRYDIAVVVIDEGVRDAAPTPVPSATATMGGATETMTSSPEIPQTPAATPTPTATEPPEPSPVKALYLPFAWRPPTP